MADAYHVKAVWDPEAAVWTSQSNIPGLVIETETLAEFEALIQALAPDLLAENVGLKHQSVVYTFTAEGRRELLVA
jgi:hypothetical protein